MVSLVNLVLKQKVVHVSFGLTKQLVIYWALYSCCKKVHRIVCLFLDLYLCVYMCICLFCM